MPNLNTFASAASPTRDGLRRIAGMTGLCKLALALVGFALLSACTTQTSVGLLQQVNFQSALNTNNPEPLVAGPQAVAAVLQRGGYIIYLRHGRTRYDQIELERDNRKNGILDLAKCETQRQLSDEGVAEMRLAGEQFRAGRWPIDQAWSSLYCRATQSAAFFVDGARATQSLSGEGEFGSDPSIKARVQAFFAQKPAPGKNHFMMAHGGIFWLATSFAVQEGHAVVLDPTNPQVIVARIAPNEWGAVAQNRRTGPN